jgi:hypothetical protein
VTPLLPVLDSVAEASPPPPAVVAAELSWSSLMAVVVPLPARWPSVPVRPLVRSGAALAGALAALPPAVEVGFELLLPVAAIFLVILVELPDLPLAPAQIVIVEGRGSAAALRGSAPSGPVASAAPGFLLVGARPAALIGAVIASAALASGLAAIVIVVAEPGPHFLARALEESAFRAAAPSFLTRASLIAPVVVVVAEDGVAAPVAGAVAVAIPAVCH